MVVTRPEELRVVVLAGGPSAERAVSLESGRGVHAALREAGVVADLVELADDDLSALDEKRFDILFLALHGAFGEDGALQRILEERGLAYTGSASAASAAAFDKIAAKDLFAARGVPTPAWCALRSDMHAESLLGLACLPLPGVVKPVRGGSSQGVTIVQRGEELAAALAEGGRYDGTLLVEEFIPGRELTVGILDGAILPVIELRPKSAFFDYHAKYEDDQTGYLCPADLPPAVAAAVGDAALEAYRAVGAEHFSRVDVMLDAQNRPWVLEVNTIPGFTSHSLLPKAAAAVGLSYAALCLRILELGWQRHLAARSGS